MKNLNVKFILASLVLFLSVQFAGMAQNDSDGPRKGFMFTLASSPKSDLAKLAESSIPPIGLMLEKGIAGFTSLGVSFAGEYYVFNDDGFASVGMTGRLVGYAFQGIEKFTDNKIDAFGLEPYIGLTFGRFWSVSFEEGEMDYFGGGNKAGFLIGTRWYPGDQRTFGIMAEYSTAGMTGMGSSFNFGITLGR